ncbi:MAG: hypothetical protein ABIJ09_03305 [Pseudomonadota bacterium]
MTLKTGRLMTMLCLLLTSSACLCVRTFDNFHYFQCRARQSEAKTGLKALWTAEQSFFAEQGRYGNLDEVGFVHPAAEAEKAYYRFTLREQDGAHFVAEARGLIAQNEREQEDVWVVDEGGEVRNTTAACLRPGGAVDDEPEVGASAQETP